MLSLAAAPAAAPADAGAAPAALLHAMLALPEPAALPGRDPGQAQDPRPAVAASDGATAPRPDCDAAAGNRDASCGGEDGVRTSGARDMGGAAPAAGAAAAGAPAAPGWPAWAQPGQPWAPPGGAFAAGWNAALRRALAAPALLARLEGLHGDGARRLHVAPRAREGFKIWTMQGAAGAPGGAARRWCAQAASRAFSEGIVWGQDSAGRCGRARWACTTRSMQACASGFEGVLLPCASPCVASRDARGLTSRSCPMNSLVSALRCSCYAPRQWLRSRDEL